MRMLAVALLTAATGCGASPQAPSAPSASSPVPALAEPAVPVVVALGDSLTAGVGLQPSESYPAVLQRRIAAAGYPHRVRNAGESGDTTTGALRRLEEALVPDTRILIVALGIN